MSHPALQPGRIGPLSLRNRIIKTATFEGMTPEGRVTPALITHHADMAKHGVGLTTVAYGAIEAEGRTFANQLWVRPEAGLDALARAVHQQGGAVSLQLSHCGGFSKLGRPQGPSLGWNAYGTAAGRPCIHPMGQADLDRVQQAFVRAAVTAADAGFDAVELHCGHGYLLSQFLSPVLNRRTDAFGGSLQNRIRFPAAVVRAVVDAVGARTAVLVKFNLSDGVREGLDQTDAISVARALQDAGAHALVVSGGLVQRSAFYLMRGEVPLAQMAAVESSLVQRIALRLFGRALVRPFRWTPGFFLDPGAAVVRAVDLPVIALGGLDSAHTLNRAFELGFAFTAMGRTLLADPDFVSRLSAGQAPTSRCTHCNLCVVEMDRGGVRCVLP